MRRKMNWQDQRQEEKEKKAQKKFFVHTGPRSISPFFFFFSSFVVSSFTLESTFSLFFALFRIFSHFFALFRSFSLVSNLQWASRRKTETPFVQFAMKFWRKTESSFVFRRSFFIFFLMKKFRLEGKMKLYRMKTLSRSLMRKKIQPFAFSLKERRPSLTL